MGEYTIIIEKGACNCSAYGKDLPHMVAAAKIEEETIELMKEGTKGC